MDFATIIGIAGAIGLLVGAILMGHDGHAGDITAFVDPVGAGIVVIGSLLTMLASLPMKGVLKTAQALLKTVFVSSTNHHAIVAEINELAICARREGILSLEQKITPQTDPFLARAVRLVVDGTDRAIVERLLKLSIHAAEERHREAKLGLDAMGKYGPAYGMVGTLIGLVLMLGNLDDPDAIGPGMAVALLGTMYGCIVSSCIFLPLADKLTYYSGREKHLQEMILEGVLAIAEGDNPRVVSQKLDAFLSQSEQSADRSSASEGA